MSEDITVHLSTEEFGDLDCESEGLNREKQWAESESFVQGTSEAKPVPPHVAIT